MQTATINVRLPSDLKRGGDKILRREGISASDAIRSIYIYMEREQKLPECLETENGDVKQTLIERRRALMQSLVGTISANVDMDKVKAERLAHKTRPGVRE